MSLFAPTVPLAFHDASMAAERVRYAALLEKYHALKLAGAEVPSVPSPLAPATPRLVTEPDEMRDLIDAKAGGNLQMRKMMLRQLATDRAGNVDEDTIRDAILNGVSSDGVPT